MEVIATPKVPKVFPYVLTEDEITALIRAAKGNARDYAVLLFLLDTGVQSF